MLGDDLSAQTATRILEAGTYRLTYSILSENGGGYYPFHYDQFVLVSWSRPVSQSAATWGAVKSIYR